VQTHGAIRRADFAPSSVMLSDDVFDPSSAPSGDAGITSRKSAT